MTASVLVNAGPGNSSRVVHSGKVLAIGLMQLQIGSECPRQTPEIEGFQPERQHITCLDVCASACRLPRRHCTQSACPIWLRSLSHLMPCSNCSCRFLAARIVRGWWGLWDKLPGVVAIGCQPASFKALHEALSLPLRMPLQIITLLPMDVRLAKHYDMCQWCVAAARAKEAAKMGPAPPPAAASVPPQQEMRDAPARKMSGRKRPAKAPRERLKDKSGQFATEARWAFQACLSSPLAGYTSD